MLLVTKNSTPGFVKKEAGGKGHNLYLMTTQGLPVPEWVVLGPMVYNKFLDDTGIRETLYSIIDENLPPKETSEKIHSLFINTPYPKDIEIFITNSYHTLGRACIAVRSSATDEDSASFSFAGQLSSYLYIRSLDKTLEMIKECWASGYTDRGLVYRKENGLETRDIQVAVVLQEMVLSEKSGVLFTCDPISGSPEKILINSVYGVGEGLVSGLYDADTITLNKKSGEIESEDITDKPKMLIQDVAKEDVKEVSVEESLVNVCSIDKSEIDQLHKLSILVEDYYGIAQDVEWAVQNGKVYLLQSRPVTTDVKNHKGILYVWDNSNIVESYGGITLPLTFGFAHYVYHQVYVQFCEILMVPQKQIKAMDHFLKNMLGIFYGRVYYNLLNWYKLTNILPGYKFNRKFMETMMGTDTSLADEVAERIRPPEYQNTLGARFKKIITGFKFFYFHINIQNIVDKYIKHFYSIYDVFRKNDYSNMPSDEIYADYQQLEQKLLWKWHAPIINDFLCMIHFGVFQALTKKWLSHLGENFQNDLLAGNGNLESAEPTKILITMAKEADENPELRKLILDTKAEYCLEALKQSSHESFKQRVDTYIDRFGFRCMSEMKLEQKDLHQDPSLLFVFLKNLINSGQTDLEKFELREKEVLDNAEAQLKEHMTGPKSIIYKWSLKHARRAVMNRENTRFCRTRVYGIVRSMFFGIGKDFASRDIIDQKEDIFYLSLFELKGALEGTNPIKNLRLMINARKEEYAGYADMDEPAPRFHTRGPVYWQNEHFPVEEVVQEEIDLEPNQMRGLGCSPGIIEGKVKVILSPDDNLELNGEILVTYRTDPGWIPLYPSAKGLLVERGGLLSHSAVVAREMGLPTIVSIKGLTKRIETGMNIRFDGETGVITILD